MCGITLDQSLFITLAIQEAQKDDAQPDGSADKSELPIQQSSASVPSHETAGQDAEGDAELEQHSTTEVEQAMIKSVARPGKSASEIVAGVNKEFHNDRSTDAKITRLRLSKGSQKRWTCKESEFLETLRDGYNSESRWSLSEDAWLGANSDEGSRR
ncbi:hypothetical protein GGI42DRAFT_107313 [Trichoderma sp. SZMC 28013]